MDHFFCAFYLLFAVTGSGFVQAAVISTGSGGCGPLPPPLNGDIFFENTTEGSLAFYACNESTRLMGPEIRQCGLDSVWSDVEPLCEALPDCGPLPAPLNGQVFLSASFQGSAATYFCDFGFTLNGLNFRLCGSDGLWSGCEPLCEPPNIDCGPLLPPLNGQIFIENTTFGSEATHSCDSGFIIVDGNEIRECGFDGLWSGEEPTCQESVLLPFGLSSGDELAPQFGPSDPVSKLGFSNLSCPFFGVEEDTLFVSTIGVLSFRTPFFEFFPFPFPLSTSDVLIAPFWDLSNTGIGSGGQVLFRLSDHAALLSQVGSTINNALDGDFSPALLFIATWDRIPASFGNNLDMVNTFQAVLATDGTQTYVMFLYHDIQSNTGVTSIGLNAGDGVSFITVPESLTVEGVLNLPNTSNVGLPGVYIFRVDQTPAQVDCGPLFPPLNGQITIGNTTTGNIATHSCDSGFIISDGSEIRVCSIDGLWSGEETTCQESVLLPFGLIAGDELVPPFDSSDPVSKLGFSNLSCPFFGVEEDTLFVSTFGVLSFRTPLFDISPLPFPLSTSDVLIAPFWDFLINGIGSRGQVLFRLSDHAALLSQVGSTINDALDGDFSPALLFIATWDRIPVFGNNSDMINTFQAVVATDGTQTYVMFLYHDIQSDSGVTTIGFNAGDGVNFITVPESLTVEGVLNLTNTSNVGLPGVYIYRVDQAPPQVDCGPLLPPLNGQIIIGNTTAGNIATYLCDSGFIIDSNDIRVCGPNGLWSGDEPICVESILFPFGVAVGDEITPAFDDGSSDPVSKLAFSNLSCPFYGVEEDTLYVSTNGVLSFRAPFTDFSSRPFPLSVDVLIAPFWDDADVGNGGQILFRLTNSDTLLNQVGSTINDIDALDGDFSPALLFIATWDSVPEFGADPNIVNTFQAVLATDGTQTYVMFLYQDIQWSSSATSIGFNAGDGVNFITVPESLTVEGVLNLTNTSNVGLPGVYIYRVDQTPPQVDCGPLLPPLNGQIIIGNTTAGNIVTYLCDSGFIIDSNDIRVCGPNGLWSGDEPTCVAQVDCGPLLPPLNGQIIIGNTTTGNIATYLCDSGFIISDGNETRMCGFDGLWSDEEPTCVESILFPFGVAVGDEITPAFDDGSSDPVSKLAFSNLSCPFYGVEEDTLYVSTNGVLSFRAPFTDFSSRPFPLSVDVLIAPFWDDSNVGNGGQILFRLTNSDTLLNQAGSTINDIDGDFSPALLFIATWDRVPEFGADPNIINTFQAVLATDGTQTYVMFLYQDIQWSSATSIGLNAGDGFNFVTVPESLTVEGVLNLTSTSNVGIPGVYIYRVDQAPSQVDCGPLLPPLNGQITIENTTAGNIATYLCDSGFIISDGNEIRECSIDGLWSGEEPTCQESVLFPFGLTAGDELVPPFIPSDPVSKLGFSNLSCPFFGVEEDTLFVSTFGVLSFRTPFFELFSLPFPLPTSDVLIAPFWDFSNIGFGSGGQAPFWDFSNIGIESGGQVLFRLSDHAALLSQVGSTINDAFDSDFSPALLFIATWDRIPVFGNNSDIVNTFQAVLATDGTQTYVMFLYHDIQSDSGVTTIGFNAGDGVNFITVPESLTVEGVLNLTNTSNVDLPGVYIYRVDQPSTNLLPFGEDVGDQLVLPADDSFSAPLFKFEFSSVTCPVFGSNEDAIYVNTNGVISFREPFVNFITQSFPLASNNVLLAPFWDDIDISRGGQILFRTTTDPAIIDIVGNTISDSISFGDFFSPEVVFIATWNMVPQFSSTNSAEVNTFQVVLATDGSRTYAGFIYQDIQWSSSTTIGINAGNQVNSIVVPESFTSEGTLNLESTTNIGVPGIYIFRIDEPFPSVELIVGTGEISVQEPDLGESSVVSTCLTAFIGQPLDRVAAFVVTLSDSTTATFGIDFIMPNFTSPILKIPADLAGSYVKCIETVIIGNDIAEGDKVIRMEVTPLFSVDSVAFSGSDEGSIVINILENDVVDCGPLPPPTNGEIMLGSTTQDSIANFSCNEGFLLDGSEIRLCGSDGMWSGSQPTCEENVIMIEFEQDLYEEFEDIGLDDFALRVCMRISNVTSERTIRVSTASGTAIGGEDYVSINRDLTLFAGDSRRCVGIVLNPDDQPESRESFFVYVEEVGASTIVTIIDEESVDDALVRYVENSPIVIGTSVTFILSFGADISEATCALVIGRRTQTTTDCSAGLAEFPDVNGRINEFIPVITLTRRNDDSLTTLMDEARNLRLGVNERCSVHLINDGVTRQIINDNSGFNVVTVIEWGLSAPADTVVSEVTFTCILDGEAEPCDSPYMTGPDLASGSHTLMVTPTRTTENCNRAIPRSFSFVI